jgi:hypothetical protein
MQPNPPILAWRHVFLSTGIPRQDWPDPALQRHEIVEAVMATARAVLGAGARLLFGGHPLITPLVFTVAQEELGRRSISGGIDLFQSEFFSDTLPEDVWGFREAPWATVHDIPATSAATEDTDVVVADKRRVALQQLREAMLGAVETFAGAVFIGGEGGIPVEYEMIRRRGPDIPCYPIGRPGGAARSLEATRILDPTLLVDLQESGAYTFLSHRIVEDMARQLYR